MPTFHHASHLERLSKVILLKKTISVLEMAATLQIDESHQKAPARLNLVAIKN